MTGGSEKVDTDNGFQRKEKTWAFCDKCGNGYSWEKVLSRTRVYENLRRKGRTVGKLLLCEECKGITRKEREKLERE